MGKRASVGAAITGTSVLARAPRYIERSVTITAVIAVPGIGAVIAGGFVGSVLGVILASFGAILLTVALLSVLYDAFLKDVLLGEVYDAMGIAEQTKAVALQQIVRNDEFEVEAFLADGSTVTALPLDPGSWHTSAWPIIRDHAKSKAVSVTVLLPAHDGDHVQPFADRLGEQSDDISKLLAGLPDKLGASWDEGGVALSQSTLAVWLYSAVPATGLLVTENRIMIEFPPALSYPTANRRSVCLITGRTGTSSLLSDLVTEQLTQERLPRFSSSIRRPQPPAVTPDTPVAAPVSDEPAALPGVDQ